MKWVNELTDAELYSDPYQTSQIKLFVKAVKVVSR